MLLAGLALKARQDASGPSSASQGKSPQKPEQAAQLLCIALPACATALLLAVTNHLTQNVAPVPFLWVVPLALYLLSFVLTFGRRSWYHRGFWMRAMAFLLALMAYVLQQDFVNAPILIIAPIYLFGLFVCCLVLHGEVARLKPAPRLLTSYYLRLSLGGALGGFFVTVIAPLAYKSYFELHVALGACAVLALLVLHHDPQSPMYQARWQAAWLVCVGMTLALAGGLAWIGWEGSRIATVSARNFYGTLRVMDVNLPKVVWLEAGKVHEFPRGLSARKLIHGSIDHGTQFHDPERRYSTTAYYVARSGVALAIREAAHRGPVRVGVVGLGTGTIAALGVRGDLYRFYEINPQVIEFAQREFTYLSDTHAKVEIVRGDARLSMEREPPQNYDVLAVDAFSGDAIPIHLLTVEAFREYFRHLKPGGALALHISNQHLALQPVVQKAAEALGKRAVVVESTADDPLGTFRAFWVVMSDREGLFEDTEIKAFGRPLQSKPNLRLWTDEYSNVLQVLRYDELKTKILSALR